MAKRLGLFDPDLRDTAQFDPDFVIDGWFSGQLIEAVTTAAPVAITSVAVSIGHPSVSAVLGSAVPVGLSVAVTVGGPDVSVVLSPSTTLSVAATIGPPATASGLASRVGLTADPAIGSPAAGALLSSSSSLSAGVTIGRPAVSAALAERIDLSSASFPAVVLDRPPIGYWRFGDPDAPATDLIGSNDGMPTGADVAFGQPGAVAGDSAVTFTSTADRIVVPEDPSLHTGDVLSIAYWARRTTTGQEYVSVKVGYSEWYTGFTTGDHAIFGCNGLPGGFRSFLTVTDTEWHHYAFTKDGPVVHAYIDAVESTLDTGTVTVDHTSPGDIWFGVNSFVGSLDEFTLDDYPLTAAEVAALSAARSSGVAVGPPTPSADLSEQDDLAVAATVSHPALSVGLDQAAPAVGLSASISIGRPDVQAEIGETSDLTVSAAVDGPSVAVSLSLPGVENPLEAAVTIGGPAVAASLGVAGRRRETVGGTVRPFPRSLEPVPFLDFEVGVVIGPPRVHAMLWVDGRDEVPPVPEARPSFNRQVLLAELDDGLLVGSGR